MKLYANINSDRSSKGQGGNKHITAEFLKGEKSRQIFLTVRAVVSEDKKDVNIRILEGDLSGRLVYNVTRTLEIDIPCEKCGGVRDMNALICSHCNI